MIRIQIHPYTGLMGLSLTDPWFRCAYELTPCPG